MPIDIISIREAHRPLKLEFKNEKPYEICRRCRMLWPCDARQLLDILETTPDVPPPPLDEVQRGNFGLSESSPPSWVPRAND